MVGINNIWVSYSSVHNRWKERDKAQILVDETQGNRLPKVISIEVVKVNSTQLQEI